MQTPTDDNTLDKINSWASNKYAAASPSLAAATMPMSVAPTDKATSGNTGLLAAASSPTRTAGTAVTSVTPSTTTGGQVRPPAPVSTTSQPASQPANDVSDWYRAVLGKAISNTNSAPTAATAPVSPAPQLPSLPVPAAFPTSDALTATPATIGKGDLTTRAVTSNETVAGQLKAITAADSPLLQQARAAGMRTAADRGLGNSTMAASAGEDSLLRAAIQVATPDAATYSKANDYNAAAQNQAVMYNADQANQFAQANKNIAAQSELADKNNWAQAVLSDKNNAAQSSLADKNNAAQSALTDKNIQAQQIQQAAQLAQQMSISQMQDQTTRWQQEQQNSNSRYNTDASYKQQIDNQKLGVANNIIQNMDLSPDRKAAMLQELGFGIMAQPGQAGSGLAGAVYVIDSTLNDLYSPRSVYNALTSNSSGGGGSVTTPRNNSNSTTPYDNGNGTYFYGPDSPGWG